MDVRHSTFKRVAILTSTNVARTNVAWTNVPAIFFFYFPYWGLTHTGGGGRGCPKKLIQNYTLDERKPPIRCSFYFVQKDSKNEIF